MTLNGRPAAFRLAFAAVVFGSYVQATPEIPSFLRICRRSDPHLNECVKHSVNSLRPYLKSGIPALHIPPCEPLNVPEIELSQASGPVSVSSSYSNIEIWGGTEFILKSVKLDLDKSRIRLKLNIPRLEMQADYTMQGKILMLPIMGHGRALGNYTDIDVITTIQGERYQDRNTRKTHFRVLEFYCDFDVGHANIHLDNLFNGDETLADAMNLFLNDNWKTVAAEIKPGLEDTVSKLFKNFSNKIYAKYPLDTLLPP
ncbi:protein takeout-like [Phymastichus coffea]|uniref:protein takeout-like n=1 Tax=Phymastichus coffea TaxID=108790 RepID=UPI00273B241A|nr:protein takeout-like [Phymastichus coffea]